MSAVYVGYVNVKEANKSIVTVPSSRVCSKTDVVNGPIPACVAAAILQLYL